MTGTPDTNRAPEIARFLVEGAYPMRVPALETVRLIRDRCPDATFEDAQRGVEIAYELLKAEEPERGNPAVLRWGRAL